MRRPRARRATLLGEGASARLLYDMRAVTPGQVSSGTVGGNDAMACTARRVRSAELSAPTAQAKRRCNTLLKDSVPRDQGDQ